MLPAGQGAGKPPAGRKEASCVTRMVSASPGWASKEADPAFYLEIKTKSCSGMSSADTKFVACNSSCKCRFCDKCALRMGLALKLQLFVALVFFTECQMWTLTLDPKLFNSPLDAYNFVRRKRIISKLVAELYKRGHLHTKRYFWVLECQKNGMPHWHLVLDASYVPFAEFCDVWNRLGKERAEGGMLGGVRYSMGSNHADGKKRFEGRKHAVNYLLKYVTKSPKEGWPEWVMNYTGNIMRYRASNGLFRVSESVQFEQGQSEATKEVIEEYSRGPYHRKQTVKLRVAQCGKESLIFSFNDSRGYKLLGRLRYGGADFRQWFRVPEGEDFILPAPGVDPLVDMGVWAWLGMSELPRILIKGQGEFVHVDPIPEDMEIWL